MTFRNKPVASEGISGQPEVSPPWTTIVPNMLLDLMLKVSRGSSLPAKPPEAIRVSRILQGVME
jgi:hypothetical protein